MDFLIADSFTDSLGRLSGEEQKAVKTTAFDLQLNPVNPGMSLHKLDKARDRNFWSVRAGSDIRLIVHKTPARPPLFAALADDELLGYGVPPEWLAEVKLADEDSLLELADHLPAEAAEALLELATGGKPQPAPSVAPGIDPFAHPDALRRFRVMNNVEELTRALEFPWEKWTIFLHPAQRELVERDYSGPARVSGSAGTGKTIVALHRAVFLARSNPESRVLLATFSETLANALRTKLRRLISSEPMLAERLEVHAMNAIGERLYELHFGLPRIASREVIQQHLAAVAANAGGLKFSPNFLLREWEDVVDTWQLECWEAYRDVKRLGRKTRLPEAQRAALWSVFEAVRGRLGAEGLMTRATLFSRLAVEIAGRSHPPFEHVVIDEAQDVDVPQLRFLAALGAGRPNGLFFAGDLGQRIFQQPFSWKSVGVDIRGRSRTLHINYRTSHQIRTHADRLLGPELADVDGNVESRRGTVSIFNGAAPGIATFGSIEEEIAVVADWLADRRDEGLMMPHEIGIFVRSEAELDRARSAADRAGLPFKLLDEHVETMSGKAAIGTMHLAKGMEFRAVVVMACDDEVIPLQSRIEAVADDADLEEVYNTERHLLYVACTRARGHLLATDVEPGSGFLNELRT